MRRSARRGWAVVAGAFAVMFVAFGCIYSFTAFFASLEAEFGASRGDLSWVLSIATFLYFTVGAGAGILADRLGPRGMALAGAAVVGIGLIAAGRAEALWQVYAGCGIGVGVGIGFSYVPAVGAVQHWFVRRRGFASGVAVSGIGVGTLCVPKLADWLIAAQGWRGAYLTLGGLAIVAGGLAALFLDGPPQKRGLLPDGGVGGAAGAASSHAVAGMTLGAAVRSPAFLLLYAAFFCASIGLFIPFVHLTPFAEDRGIAHSTAVTLFALIGIGSTVGRFAIGGFADRLGRRRSLIAMFVGIAAIMLWWLVSTEAWQIAVFALVFGTCYGGFVALSPALLVDHFGSRNAGGIIGAAYTSVALGTLAGPPLAGYAFDVLRSYSLPIAGGAAMTLIGVLLIFLVPEPRRAR